MFATSSSKLLVVRSLRGAALVACAAVLGAACGGPDLEVPSGEPTGQKSSALDSSDPRFEVTLDCGPAFCLSMVCFNQVYVLNTGTNANWSLYPARDPKCQASGGAASCTEGIGYGGRIGGNEARATCADGCTTVTGGASCYGALAGSKRFR